MHLVFLLDSVHKMMKGMDILLGWFIEIIFLLRLRGKFRLFFGGLSGRDILRCIEFGQAILTFEGRNLVTGLIHKFLWLGVEFCVFEGRFEFFNGF